MDANHEGEQMSRTDGDAEVSTDPIEPEAQPATSVVPLDDGMALVVGELPEGWTAVPTTFLGPREHEALGGMLQGVGLLNAGAQTLHGWQQSAHLVRLAPESVTALATGTPLVKDGWNLGTVMANGKFAHQVRWLPAGGATAAGVAASAGTALTLIAIQAQIAEVADIATETLDVAKDLLQEVRSDRWNQTRALFEVMAGGIREAKRVGGATDGVWANVAGRDVEIRKARHDHLAALQHQLEQLESRRTAAARLKWIEENAVAALHDAELLLMSNQAWLMYAGLRISHLAQDEERNRGLIDEIVADVRREHAVASRAAVELIDRVHAALDVLVDRPGRALLPVGKTRRAAKDVRRLAEVHRDALERTALEQVAALVPVPDLPGVVVGSSASSTFDRTRRRLRWILQKGETVDALAVTGRGSARKLLVLTSERLLVLHAEAVLERGDTTLMLDVPTDQIRFVRCVDHGKRDAMLRIVCRDQDIDLVVPDRQGDRGLYEPPGCAARPHDTASGGDRAKVLGPRARSSPPSVWEDQGRGVGPDHLLHAVSLAAPRDLVRRRAVADLRGGPRRGRARPRHGRRVPGGRARRRSAPRGVEPQDRRRVPRDHGAEAAGAGPGGAGPGPRPCGPGARRLKSPATRPWSLASAVEPGEARAVTRTIQTAVGILLLAAGVVLALGLSDAELWWDGRPLGIVLVAVGALRVADALRKRRTGAQA